jgi:hypothetical protein
MPLPERVEIRQPLLLRVWIAGFGVVWCGFLVAMLANVSAPTGVVPLLMLAFGATLYIRLFRLAVVANEDGLFVRNGLRTRRFDWSQIEDFRIRHYGQSIVVLLRDGGSLGLDVTRRPWLFASGRAQFDACFEGLRAWVKA